MDFKMGSFNKHIWKARSAMACLQRQAVFPVPLDNKKCLLKLAYLVDIDT